MFLKVSLCYDTTQSYYTLIQTLCDKLNENALVDADNVPATTQTQYERAHTSKNRLIMLQLTDGTRRVKAMEYIRIPALDDDLPPGTKVKLQGKMDYSNGVLLLCPENLVVLGGNVEDLNKRDEIVKALSEELYVKSKNTFFFETL